MTELELMKQIMETHIKAVQESASALNNVHNSISGIREDVSVVKSLFENGIMEKIEKRIEREMNLLFWKFSGILAIIATILGIIAKWG